MRLVLSWTWRQQRNSRTPWEQRFFWTVYTTLLTDRSTCKPSVATIWSAPVTKYSLLIWDFCGVAANYFKDFRLSVKTSSQMSRQEKSRPARSFMRMSPEWRPQSAIWKDWERR